MDAGLAPRRNIPAPASRSAHRISSPMPPPPVPQRTGMRPSLFVSTVTMRAIAASDVAGPGITSARRVIWAGAANRRPSTASGRAVVAAICPMSCSADVVTRTAPCGANRSSAAMTCCLVDRVSATASISRSATARSVRRVVPCQRAICASAASGFIRPARTRAACPAAIRSLSKDRASSLRSNCTTGRPASRKTTARLAAATPPPTNATCPTGEGVAPDISGMLTARSSA